MPAGELAAPAAAAVYHSPCFSRHLFVIRLNQTPYEDSAGRVTVDDGVCLTFLRLARPL